MPLIDTGPHSLPYLQYNAPVDEKTLALREKFKIDTETGYPEHYKWRPLARLGYEYKPSDPYLKFGEYNPDYYIMTKITLYGTGFAGLVLFQTFRCYYMKRPWISKLWQLPVAAVPIYYAIDWFHERSLERAGRKAATVVDYCEKHPERFGTIKRHKLRELLFTYTPIR